MGDWIVRTHWAVAADEGAALEAYERLEAIAAQIRREGSHDGGATILRFGFGAPRLVIAIASQKWGESEGIATELAEIPGVRLLVTDGHEVLLGELAVLEPEHVCVWSDDEATLAALARVGLAEARVGAVRVRVLDATRAAALIGDAGDGAIFDPEPLTGELGPADLIACVASRAHGLVPLAHVTRAEDHVEWALGSDSMPLFAARIEGSNNSVVICDHAERLPETHLFDDDAWRLERHGPHHVFLTEAQRGSLVRAALASPLGAERRAGRAMMRRWGMREDGARVPAPCRPRGGALEGLPSISAVGRYAGVLRGDDGGGWREGLAVFREVGDRLDELARAGRGDRLGALACRFAELAHAVSRTSYWMVRDGAPGPDRPELPGRPLGKIWGGQPDHLADRITFWAAAAAVAMHEREREPAGAAAAALLALEGAVEAATGRWWTPAPGWLAAIAHADVTLDADADVDPTVVADPELDAAGARSALARLAEGEALAAAAEPARAAAVFEEAHAAARVAKAPVLALRAHYRWLGALKAAGDLDRFAAEAERLLRELPSPVAIFPLGTAGELATTAIQWTANWIAWHAHLRGEHARCLDVVERALLFAKPTEWHDNIRDTKVRALLALGRADEAYAIVHEVLGRAPGFEVFADLAASDAYRAWCEQHRPAAPG